MTNGAGAVGHTHRHVGPSVGVGMASFMTKKKKYKFHVDVCLEELVEVPFVSAVLFAKLRLLDGGSFQDTSSRQEVLDHRVQWNASFTFPCKMMANASTGVMERCVLRVSVRKESKGGRSFTKLGFVDLNLAEYAGAGVVRKKALLEGYDARRRQDNSMLKFRIELSMVSGDILFKAPSPSLKHKQINVDESGNEQRSEEFSSGSLAGSIASGSSGFGSLPKKRPALLSSDLVIGQTLQENNPSTNSVGDCAVDQSGSVPSHQDLQEQQAVASTCTEPGHSRNSSNTSQLSKASGYSSGALSHSRQSSSGDSGHVRNQQHSHSVRARNPSTPAGTFFRTNTYPKKIYIPNTIPSHQEVFSTPECLFTSTPTKKPLVEDEVSLYSTPKGFFSQNSTGNSSSTDEYKTPETSGNISARTDVFSQNFNELQKSSSTSVVERIKTDMLKADLMANQRKSDTVCNNNKPTMQNGGSMKNLEKENNHRNNAHKAVLRSKSEFQIPKVPPLPPEKSLTTRLFNSNSLISFLTPRLKRKSFKGGRHSPPNLLLCPNPSSQALKSLPETRATSLSSLRSGCSASDVQRGLHHHRKLLEGASTGKLAPLAISPDDEAPPPAQTPGGATNDTVVAMVTGQLTLQQGTVPNGDQRRCSITTNPSAGSLVISETGSLDRAKSAYERRKKNKEENELGSSATAPGRVEITRVNPDDLIEELLKNTNLETADDSAETSGLQLFIAKDGTAAVGNHEVKSQMQTGGVQIFKQVVMDDR